MAPLMSPQPSCKLQVNDLHTRGVAVVAALSGVRNHLNDPSLRDLITNYIAVTRRQIERLADFAGDHGWTLNLADESEIRTELRGFARELARGLLSRQLELSAVDALLRLALRRLDQYRDLGEQLPPATAAPFLAGEAEETAMIDSLSFHRELLISEVATPRLAE